MAKVCTNSALYDSLNFCKGKTVLPGIRSRLFYIPKRDIVKWPTLPDTAEDGMGELATYTGDFVLEADKHWNFIDLIDNKGKIESESQGDKPARTFLNKTSVVHPDTDEEATGFCRQANADDFVYLLQRRDGKFRVLGNKMFETDTKPKQDGGEGVTGDFGTTLEIEVTDVCPPPYYTGKILTADGTISGETGEPVTD
jgi:hypothetical protein